MSPQYNEPLTTSEFDALVTFLATHHPPIYSEVLIMEQRQILDEVPILLRMLYDDMNLHLQGKPTKFVKFL